jgi:hypothetical protein
MSTHSDNQDLKVVVAVQSHEDFEELNDFVCFKRHLVKDYSWEHPIDPPSMLHIEFFDATEALLFKLKWA